MSRTAPTLQQIVTGLLAAAGREVAAKSAHLIEVPMAWEGTRNAVERLRGLEVAEIVLRDQGMLEDSGIEDLRFALGTLRTARTALMAVGEGRKADAVDEVRRAVAKVIEGYLAASFEAKATGVRS